MLTGADVMQFRCRQKRPSFDGCGLGLEGFGVLSLRVQGVEYLGLGFRAEGFDLREEPPPRGPASS